MNRREKPLSCARVQVLVEPFLDGELSAVRRQRFEAHMQQCVACSAARDAARAIQVSLRDLPEIEFPAAAREQLLDQLAAPADAGSPSWQRGLADTVTRIWDALLGKNAGASAWLRPAAALAAVVLVVFLWAQQRQPQQAVDVAQVSQQELHVAEQQARWALAYLTRVTARAGDTAFYRVGDVMGEVIGEHVLGSVTDAVGRSMQPVPAVKAPGELEKEVQTP